MAISRMSKKFETPGAENDKDTQEIMAELEAEGALEEGDESESDGGAGEPDDKAGADGDGGGDGSDGGGKPKADEKPAKADGDGAGDDADGDDEKPVELKDGNQRPQKYVSLDKHKQKMTNLEARLKREHADEIAAIKADAAKGKPVADKVEDLKENAGADAEAIARIVQAELKKSGIALSPEERQALRRNVEQAKEATQDAEFDKEFKALLKDAPDAADHKDALRELAFGDEHGGKSLYEIYHRYHKPALPNKKKTAEPSRGGTRNAKEEIDFADVDKNPDLLDEMTDEQLDSYFESKKGSKAPLRRNGKPV